MIGFAVVVILLAAAAAFVFYVWVTRRVDHRLAAARPPEIERIDNPTDPIRPPEDPAP